MTQGVRKTIENHLTSLVSECGEKNSTSAEAVVGQVFKRGISRRRLMQSVFGATLLSAFDIRADVRTRASRLGLVTYSCRKRREHLRKQDPDFDLFDPLHLLAHCQSLGAGGMQLGLGVLDLQEAIEIRRKAAEANLFVEAIISVPFEQKQVDRFEAELKTAANAGASVARTTIIPGRRYEYFDSLEAFRTYEARGVRALERAAPIAERHQVAIAVENHKDHRNQERVALFERISSPFVGACVDTGNSLSLLEDPIETVQSLAPWAHSVHLKDQSLLAYEDGFLLGDIPLGQGSLDLKRIVEILRTEKPMVNFSLELITRDPLKVPVFEEKFWATFPDLPAIELARHLRFVNERAKNNLQYISRMSAEQQLSREDANVRESLAYARQHLGL